MASDEIADLFGDFDSADESQGASQGAAASSSTAAPPAAAAPAGNAAEQELASELFGDFDSGDEAKPHRRLKKRSAEEASAPSSSDAAGQPKKARKRPDIMKFADLEAQEAGASGDEDDGEDEFDDLIDDTGMGAGDRKKVHSQLQRQHNKELREAEIEAGERGGDSGARRVYGSSFLNEMEEKYKDMAEREAAGLESPRGRAMEQDEQTNTVVVPDPQDPKLWCVKTFGPEQDLTLSVMLKASQALAEGRPVHIFSCFTSKHLRGYIYIEAFQETHVRDFVRGIRGISPWSIVLVPASQMPQVFTASVVDAQKHISIHVGEWVRIKRGPYEGDLAQIEEKKDEQTYTLRLKPRLQYGMEAGKKRQQDKASKAAKKRPPARWFNKADLAAAGVPIDEESVRTSSGIKKFFLVNEETFRDGFLYKGFRRSYFLHGDQVRPQEAELQDWRIAPPVNENTRPKADLEDLREAKLEDAKMMPPPPTVPTKKLAAADRVPLQEGDNVVVITGDLVNLKGKVTLSLRESPTVLVKPIGIGEIRGDISIAAVKLSKYFEVGDYVKVQAGERRGDVGYVVAVNPGEKGKWTAFATVKVLSASLATEFEVRVEHVGITSYKADQTDEVGEFKVEQLVRVDSALDTRGVIIRIEAGSRAVVLNTNGKTTSHEFSELEPVALPDKRVYRSTVWTLDKKGQRIAPACVVKAPRGLARSTPIKAVVLYICDQYCFMKASESLTGWRAYLVAPGSRCEFVWKQQEAAKDKDAEAPSLQGQMQYGIKMASETSWVKEWFQKMMGIDANKESKMWSKGAGIRINGGSYKGLRGEVRELLGDAVRVSLLAKPKLVLIPLRYIAPDEYLEKSKASRWPQTAAPATPPGDFSGRPAPETPRPDLDAAMEQAPGLLDEDQPLNDENQWDPNFLMPKAAPAPPPREDAIPSPSSSTAAEDEPAVANLLFGRPEAAASLAGRLRAGAGAAIYTPSDEAEDWRLLVSPNSEGLASRGSSRRKARRLPAAKTAEAPSPAQRAEESWLAQALPADAMVDESPMTVGEQTPAAMLVQDTPPLAGVLTPLSTLSGSFPGSATPQASMFMPMPGGATPMLPGLGGGVTPKELGGAATPQFGKEETKPGAASSSSGLLRGFQGGDQTPALPMDGVKGEATPTTVKPLEAKAKKDEQTPGFPGGSDAPQG